MGVGLKFVTPAYRNAKIVMCKGGGGGHISHLMTFHQESELGSGAKRGYTRIDWGIDWARPNGLSHFRHPKTLPAN